MEMISIGPVVVYVGKCEDALKAFPDASVDAIVTDPPYGLEFMGKDWDAPWKTGDGFRRAKNKADAGRDNAFGRASRTSPEYLAGVGFQRWVETWAAECLRGPEARRPHALLRRYADLSPARMRD